METPRVSFATTSDGIPIAYAVFGHGAPLVLVDAFLAGGLDVRFGSWRSAALYEALHAMAANRTVVSFDWRNSGLSDHVSEINLEGYVRDLEAVVDHLDLDKADICGLTSGCQVALEYAAIHQDRVRKLAFIWPRPKGYLGPSDLGPTLSHLVSTDWEAFTALYALRTYGWQNGREFMEELRKHWSPDEFQAFMAAVEEFDAFPRASSIDNEALVIGPGNIPERLRAAQQLAALLPNGHLTVNNDGPHDATQIKTVDAFLGEFAPYEARGEVRSLQTAPLRVILFTDIEAHTAMMQRLGDTRGRELLREYERIVRDSLRAHGGTEVKNLGDGFMAAFDSANRALECAVALQQAFVDEPIDGERLSVRVGLNAGEPIAEDDDLFGSSVILAARTADQARGGEVLVTNVVRELVAGKGFVFVDRGEIALRGFENPVRLHELRWQEMTTAYKSAAS
jgi:class 3 adenylate cyclase